MNLITVSEFVDKVYITTHNEAGQIVEQYSAEESKVWIDQDKGVYEIRQRNDNDTLVARSPINLTLYIDHSNPALKNTRR